MNFQIGALYKFHDYPLILFDTEDVARLAYSRGRWDSKKRTIVQIKPGEVFVLLNAVPGPETTMGVATYFVQVLFQETIGWSIISASANLTLVKLETKP